MGLLKVSDEDNVGDALTKAVPIAKFSHCLKILNVTTN